MSIVTFGLGSGMLPTFGLGGGAAATPWLVGSYSTAVMPDDVNPFGVDPEQTIEVS